MRRRPRKLVFKESENRKAAWEGGITTLPSPYSVQMGKLRPRKGQDLLMSDPELPRHSLLKWSLVRQTDFES